MLLNDKMLEARKFDKKNFLIHSVDGRASYVAKGNTLIFAREFEGFYLEEIRIKANNPNAARVTYFKSNLRVKSIEHLFYGNPTGETKQYSEDGKIAGSKNIDQEYPFSFDDVIKKCKKDFNVDLSIFQEQISVKRYLNDQTKMPEYSIRIPINESSFHYIILDGNTGETKKDFIGNYIE